MDSLVIERGSGSVWYCGLISVELSFPDAEVDTQEALLSRLGEVVCALNWVGFWQYSGGWCVSLTPRIGRLPPSAWARWVKLKDYANGKVV